MMPETCKRDVMIKYASRTVKSEFRELCTLILLNVYHVFFVEAITFEVISDVKRVNQAYLVYK